MADSVPLSIAGPASRGAQWLALPEFNKFVSQAVERSRNSGVLGALIIVRFTSSECELLSADEMTQAGHLLMHSGRQADALSRLDLDTFAFASVRLTRRGDVHILMDRFVDICDGLDYPWELTMGAAIFPLSGEHPGQIWDAAREDLEGALSCEHWDHNIPRDTVRVVGGL